MAKVPFDEVISVRITKKTKEKLAKTGYNGRDAINYFVQEYYTKNPKKKLQIKKELMEIRLHDLKEQECEIQVKISELERELEALSLDTIDDVPVQPMFVEEESDDYPVEVLEALELVQNAFDMKRDMLVSPKTDISEAVDSFIVLHGDVVHGAFKKCNGLNWKEFKEILLSEIS